MSDFKTTTELFIAERFQDKTYIESTDDKLVLDSILSDKLSDLDTDKKRKLISLIDSL